MRPAVSALRLSAGFVIALVGAEMVVGLVGSWMPEPSVWPTVETDLKSHQLTEMERGPAIVLLGSSITEAAVDPVILEELTGLVSSYNSAMPFSSPLSNEIWIEEILLPAVEPTLLVIGLPAWPPHRDDERLMVEKLERAVKAQAFAGALEWSSLAGKRGVLADWDQLARRARLKTSGLWTDLGHQTGYYNRSGGSIARRFTTFGDPAMISEQAEALERVIISLRDSGVDVVLLLEPGRFPGDATESEVTAYLEWLEGMSTKWGIQLWDAYSIDWDESFFADEVHFNRSGTKAFTAYLAGLVNDHVVESG